MFEDQMLDEEQTSPTSRPLAERQRPKVFDDLVGQDHIWAPGAPLRQLVEADRFHGLLLWGPPGTGKTSLARIIGSASHRPVVMLSAVLHGVKEIRIHLEEGAQRVNRGASAPLLFMDEIHRLTKSQQDVLLPALEAGTIRFIGATTENPSFEVNGAILSRVLVFKLERLSETALLAILKRAIDSADAADNLRRVTDPLCGMIARAADGDARRALTLLDAVAAAAPSGGTPITPETVTPAILKMGLKHDKSGDQHYDLLSALIKSIRASQPDAALYYLARLLEAGEDPLLVARRLVIAASEDVGHANPTALLVATSVMQGVHAIGMPEARILLSQATTYLAASPKSNRSYLAIDRAIQDVRDTGTLPIPMALRNAPTRLMKEMGYGAGYLYAHDDPVGAQGLNYFPETWGPKQAYFEPSDIGAEAHLKRYLLALREAWRVRQANPRGKT